MALQGWEPGIGREPRVSWVSQKLFWAGSQRHEEKCVAWMKIKNLSVILKVVSLERASEKLSPFPPAIE